MSFTLKKLKGLCHLYERPESENTKAEEIGRLLYHKRKVDESMMNLGTMKMQREAWCEGQLK